MAVRIEQDGNVTIFAGANKHPIATATVPVAADQRCGQNSAADRSDKSAPGAPAARLPSAGSAGQTRSLPPRPASDSIRRAVVMDRRHRRTGTRWPRSARTGTEERQSDRRRRADRQTLDVQGYQPQSRTAAWRRCAGDDRLGQRRAALGADGVDQADAKRLSKHRARRPANLRRATCCLATRHRRWQLCNPTCRSRRASKARSARTACRNRCRVGSSPMRASSATPMTPMAVSTSTMLNSKSIGTRRAASSSVPFQILSGGNRITLIGQAEAPAKWPGAWGVQDRRRHCRVEPSRRAGRSADPQPHQGERPVRSGTAARRCRRGRLGNTDVGIAMSGNADYSSGDLRLAAGVAGTRMSVDALKRLWPVFVEPKVRDWFLEHLVSGTVERLVIAVNAPFNTLKASGPPIPDDGLSVDALATNCVILPVQGLPALTMPISPCISSGATRKSRSARQRPICRPGASS